MKKISAVWIVGFFLFITIFKVQAQANTTWQVNAVKPYHVAVAFSKTTNVIFPYSIMSVDIGSRDVLAQKAKGAENILQLKAAKDSFPQTNISIVTADGKFTSLLVDYAEQPSVLNLLLTDKEKQGNLPASSEGINQQQLEHYAAMALISKEKARGMKDNSSGILFKLNGLFIHDDIMLLRFNIINNTDVNYDIGQLRLYIHDEKKARRTATQEIEISPLLVYNNISKVSGRTDHTTVLGVPRFTIPDKKYLSVQLMERNGGRNIELHVKNKKIVKAIRID
ncbi:conjugative transposon protein TraN [Parafilimonas sp.]|uniref:conjugative transposon protein TraN n=1 Tax=Parafilimonas sp. TaxID=1969739 RepID=UPI0039E62FBC